MTKYRNIIPVWQNQKILQINREPARANLIPYADEIQAIETQRGASPYFKLLNGDWKFNYSDNPAEVPEKFYCENFDVNGRRRWKYS
jgi:beta-galactosidase